MQTFENPSSVNEENDFSRWSIILWTLVGFLVLYFMKDPGNNDLDWTPAIICSVLVALYGFLVGYKFHGEQRTRLADNCYYIGLIYTLISLALVLAQLGVGSQVKVLNSFGIALLTTITGIVARLYLQEREETPETRLAEVQTVWANAQDTMNDAATQLADEAAKLINAFKEAGDGLAQSTGANMESVKSMQNLADSLEGSMQKLAQTTDGVEKSVTALGDVAARAHDGLAALGRVQPAQVQQVLDQYDKLATAAQKASDDVEQRGQRLAADMERLFPAAERLMDTLDRAAEGTAQASADLGKSIDANTTSVQSLQNFTSSLDGSMRDFVKSTSSVESSVTELGDAAKKAHEGLAALALVKPEHVQQVIDQFDRLAASTQRTSTAVDQRGQKLMDDLERLHPHTQRLIDALDSAADGTARAVAGLLRSVEADMASVQSMEKLTNSFEDSMKQLTQTTDGVEGSITGLGDAVTKAHEGLAALERMQPEQIQEVLEQYEKLVSSASKASSAVDERGKEIADEMEKLLSSFKELVAVWNKAADETKKSRWWRRRGR